MYYSHPSCIEAEGGQAEKKYVCKIFLLKQKFMQTKIQELSVILAVSIM
jgi:hypothetical protein